jgi:hypothetical protein
VIDELPSVAELIARIMREAEQTLARLAGEEPRAKKERSVAS